jgi:hypothetical protein
VDWKSACQNQRVYRNLPVIVLQPAQKPFTTGNRIAAAQKKQQQSIKMASGDDAEILHLEIIRKDEYKKWKEDPRFVGDALLKKRAPEDIPLHANRFDISHLNENFAAWNTALSVSNFYSSDEVRAMTNAQANSSSFKFAYELDDLVWECEFSVNAFLTRSGALRKTLVIHLLNDGYFYINGVEMEKYLGKVDKESVLNSRHRNTCYDGW